VATLCAALVALAMVALIPHRIAITGYYNHVSGAWAALADDVAHGVLYRPLLSDYGYGGTRYFPLHFIVHGLLAWAGLSLRVAGHLVALLSGCAVVVGGAHAFKRYGASPALAWMLALLPLASRTAFMALAGIRGDLLPVGLAVVGLACVPRDRDESFLPAAFFMSLAVLAKPTLVWAPGGALIAVLVALGLRPAIKLGALVAAITAAGMLIVVWASHGEILRSFKACASGGGVSLALWMENIATIRPGDLAWIFGGAALTIARGRRALANPLCAAGLVCIPITALLYASRGIHVNHYVDVAATGAFGVGFAVVDGTWRPVLCRRLLAICTALGLFEAALLHGMLEIPGELQEWVAAVPRGTDPILSEQPWIPLLLGERAFCLDAFSLNQTRKTVPAITTDLFNRIDSCRFRTVALLGRPEQPSTFQWYDDTQFGEGFRQHLLAAYQFKGVYGGMAFYVPRCGGPALAPSEIHDPNGETIRDRNSKPNRIRLMLNWLKHRD
jgi:hypothetical protein